MAWFYLILAGVLEVIWASLMKHSQGFTKPVATIATLIAMIASFLLLAMAMRTLPLGSSYAIWTGIGAVGAFLVGIVLFGEPLTIGRVSAALLILTGLVLMKLCTPE